MFIKFDDIPADGLHVEVQDGSWFPEAEVRRRSKLSASVSLEKSGNRVFFSGTMKVMIETDCDRCLEPYEFSLDEGFRLVLQLADESQASHDSTDIILGEDDLEVMFLERPLIDVEAILSQQLLLSLPQKRLCSSECRGLCRNCGANFNKDVCSCDSDKTTSPFSVLSTLKKK